MKKKLRVGFDFDGVIAYNPFRIVRAPIAFVKKNILGVKKLEFFYPQAQWQQIFWRVLHDSSVFPAKGMDLLEKLVKEEKIEAHLITGRYSFLDTHLDRWLIKHNVKNVFKTINWNVGDEQPHLFKEKMVKKYDLDIFIEDNLDIVKYLRNNSEAKIYWIYNIIDRSHRYKYKYPYLEAALNRLT